MPRADHAYEYKVPYDFVEEVEENMIFFSSMSLRHEIGDTRYRRISYRMEATTRFREYMEPAVPPADLKRSSEWTTVFAPNTARPKAPDVLYVIPTFGWESAEDNDTKTRTRRGGGLRVYLNRPWFSSGYGEMLAVVLFETAVGSANMETLKPYITQWGTDPIWASEPMPRARPRIRHFPGARTTPHVSANRFKELQPATPLEDYSVSDFPFPTSGFTLPERPEATFAIAPHDVGWDAERQLWYCDIEVDIGEAYYPFIRLALVRYHPNSLPGKHLSRVVLADFAQLTPDRSAAVTAVPGNPQARRVTINGPIHKGSSIANDGGDSIFDPARFWKPLDGYFNNIFEVEIERLNPDFGEDFGWQPVKVTHLPPTAVGGSHFPLWEGVVALAEEPQPGAAYRIVIKEYELFRPDEGQNPFGERRLVYGDYLPF